MIARPRFTLLITLLAVASLFAPAQEKKRLSFEQIFKNAEPRLTTALPSITGWADDTHYLESRKAKGEEIAKVYSVDAASGKESLYRDLSAFKDIVPKDFNIDQPATSDAAFKKMIYTKENGLYLLDTDQKLWKQLTESDSKYPNPTFSPDGKQLAFTRGGNLYSVDLTTFAQTQYTNDATSVIYNGWAAWLYYEEILGRGSRYKAFWWSPDSKSLAFMRFDETNVPVFPIYNSEGQHGFLENTRYPKSGDPNPQVRIGFVTAGKQGTLWAEFNEKDDQYFGTPMWTPGGELFVQWMNRRQNDIKLYSVNAATGKKREVYDETQSSWVDWFDRIDFLPDGKSFIIASDKDGWNHLYVMGLDGTLKTRLTEGPWAVAGVQAVAADRVYFTARKETSTRTDLYSVNLNGKGLKRLTAGSFTHSARVSPGGSYCIDTYSNLSTPNKMSLIRGDGTAVRELGDSKSADFSKYEYAQTEYFTVKTPDGYQLPVTWTLPLGFDKTKKYPVLISIYGGPAAMGVGESWKGVGGQWLAEEGVIQVSADHRASGHFGKAGVALMYRNLGKWEMADYGEVAKWLRAQSFVDSTKICITGGSYGGYVTCLALTARADVFTHGNALFSVTDWQLYDSHYVERYMDSPANNPDGYKAGAVMTYADKYKGTLRIVHGTMDDNVHMQNSIQLVDKLEDLGKHFEFMVYPGGRHGFGGAKGTHLRNESYRFYYKNLLNKEFPETVFR